MEDLVRWFLRMSRSDSSAPTMDENEVQRARMAELDERLSQVVSRGRHGLCHAPNDAVSMELIPFLFVSSISEELSACVGFQVSSCVACDDSFLAAVCRWRKHTGLDEKTANLLTAKALTLRCQWHADAAHSAAFSKNQADQEGGEVTLFAERDATLALMSHDTGVVPDRPASNDDLCAQICWALESELRSEIDSRTGRLSSSSVTGEVIFWPRDSSEASPMYPEFTGVVTMETTLQDREDAGRQKDWWRKFPHGNFVFISPAQGSASASTGNGFLGMAWVPEYNDAIRGRTKIVPNVQFVSLKDKVAAENFDDWSPSAARDGIRISCKVTPLPLVSHLRRVSAALSVDKLARLIPLYRDVLCLPKLFSHVVHYDRTVAQLQVDGGSADPETGGPRATSSRRHLRKKPQCHEDRTALFDMLMGSAELNDAQKSVVDRVYKVLERVDPAENGKYQAAVGDLFTLIQGPPGTGKTMLIVWLLCLLVVPSRAGAGEAGRRRVLVCAPSNLAVDTVLLRANVDSTLNSILKRDPSACPVKDGDGYDQAFNAASGRDHQAEYEDAVNEYNCWGGMCRVGRKREDDNPLVQGQEGEPGGVCVDVSSMLEIYRMSKSSKRSPQAVLKDSYVVFTTLNSAGHKLLEKECFDYIIVDEACQASEVDTYIPLLREGSLRHPPRHVILVGDRKQLPPTVCTRDKDVSRVLSRSLFEKLEDEFLHCPVCPNTEDSKNAHETGEKGAHCTQDTSVPQECLLRVHGERICAVIVLDTQYRMHPSISLFPFKTFYPNKGLKNGVQEVDRAAVYHGSQFLRPVTFIDSDGDGHKNRESCVGTSFVNDVESDIVCMLIEQISRSCPATNLAGCVSVVTPYREQVRCIQRALHQWSPDDSAIGDIPLRTIDSMQGQECDIVILSTVRANANGQLGFLNDSRRANVALTRAKRSLVVVGSVYTLEHESNADSVWASFVTHCRDAGCVTSLNDLSAYLNNL